MTASANVSMTQDRSQPLPYGGLFLMSFLVWFSATMALRLWGHVFFIPSNHWSMIASFLGALLILPPVVYGSFRWLGIQPHQRTEAATWLAIPSMLLDAVTIACFAQAFPNLAPSTASAFGAWLFWGYSIALVSGLMTSRWDESQRI